jgi:hypothetical protein
MKNIKEICIEFFHNEDTRKDIKEVLSPLVDIIYNELYVYLWVFCFYNLFLFFIILANLYLLLRLLKHVRFINNSSIYHTS